MTETLYGLTGTISDIQPSTTEQPAERIYRYCPVADTFREDWTAEETFETIRFTLTVHGPDHHPRPFECTLPTDHPGAAELRDGLRIYAFGLCEVYHWSRAQHRHLAVEAFHVLPPVDEAS